MMFLGVQLEFMKHSQQVTEKFGVQARRADKSQGTVCWVVITYSGTQGLQIQQGLVKLDDMFLLTKHKPDTTAQKPH